VGAQSREGRGCSRSRRGRARDEGLRDPSRRRERRGGSQGVRTPRARSTSAGPATAAAGSSTAPIDRRSISDPKNRRGRGGGSRLASPSGSRARLPSILRICNRIARVLGGLSSKRVQPEVRGVAGRSSGVAGRSPEVAGRFGRFAQGSDPIRRGRQGGGGGPGIAFQGSGVGRRPSRRNRSVYSGPGGSPPDDFRGGSSARLPKGET